MQTLKKQIEEFVTLMNKKMSLKKSLFKSNLNADFVASN